MAKKEYKLPDKLVKRQARQRQETMDKVQNSIDELRAEGFKVSMELLRERTNLSITTLNKDHVQAVLKANRVCKYEKSKVSDNPSEMDKYELELECARLIRELNKVNDKNIKLENKVNALKVEVYEKQERISELLGELQMLSRKSRMHGVRLELLKMEDE